MVAGVIVMLYVGAVCLGVRFFQAVHEWDSSVRRRFLESRARKIRYGRRRPKDSRGIATVNARRRLGRSLRVA